MRWSRTKVSLSRPGRAPAAITAPRRAPGLSASSACSGEQVGGAVERGRRATRRRARRARARRATAPSSARRCRAGSRTTPGTRARRPRSPSAEPGSVVAAKRAGSRVRRPRSARGGCGSRWSSPTSTRRGTACGPAASRASTRATAAGSVVSSTREVEAVGPACRTCGPAPRGTATSRPCRARRRARGRRRGTPSAKPSELGHARRRIVGRAVEPAEPVGDLGRVVLPERVVARRAGAATALRAARSASAASTASASGPSRSFEDAPALLSRLRRRLPARPSTTSSTISSAWARPGNRTS